MPQTVKQNGITEGVIWKQLLLFFFPILFGTFFQQMYNTADAIIVGNIAGKQALAAVGGSTSTIINLLVGFFVGLASGAAVIIAQQYGAREAEKISRSVHTSIALAIVGGFVLMLLGFFGGPIALQLMHTPDDIMQPATEYLQLYFLGTIPSLLYNLGSGILRAMGDSKRPLYFLIIACFTNIALDLLLVGAFRMGVKGAALATVASQVVSALLTLWVLTRDATIYQVHFSKIRMDGEMLASIVRIGLPTGLQSVLYSVSNIVIQAGVNAFGTDVVAAWTAYSKIDSVFWMTLSSFGIAITTFVGQNYGAARYDRVKKGVSVCLGMAFGSTIFISTVLYIWGGVVCRMFTSDATVLAHGERILHYLVPWYISYVLIEILSGALRGAGEVVAPTVICCFGVCGIRLLWMWIAVTLVPQLETVMASYPITWALSSITFAVYYYKSGWLEKRIQLHTPKRG